MKEIKYLFEAQASSPFETAMLYNGGIGFRIPEYQRQYDWSLGNIERLFLDTLSGFKRLESSSNADAFTFLGTLILLKETIKEEDFNGTSVAIVDGQQRITTLTLFMCALYERLCILKEAANSIDGLDAKILKWLELETEERLGELYECAVGALRLKKNKTYPFPRIVRREDARGRSPQTTEFRSPLAKFLDAFGKYTEGDENDFNPPSLGNSKSAKKLLENYGYIRDFVLKINDIDWYEDSECEPVTVDGLRRPNYKELLERLDDVFPDEKDRNQAIEDVIRLREMHSLLRLVLFSAYFSKCVVLTRVTTDDESAAFDIFDALNTTGEPLTALETLKPRVINFANSGGTYHGSQYQISFESIYNNLDELFQDTTQKQNETKDMIITFALYLEGKKLPKVLGSQRNFLRTAFDSASKAGEFHAERFVKALSEIALFRRYYWTSSGIEELSKFHSASNVAEAQLLVSFIKDMKTSLALPILARYWNENLKTSGEAQFMEALKAVAAFLIIRRAATGSTSGIDTDFRAIMSPKKGPGSGKKFELCAGANHQNVLLTVVELKDALRSLLSTTKLNIKDKERWTKQVIDNPLYNQSKELVRFMLFAAGNQAQLDPSNPGTWTKTGIKTSEHINNFLDYKTWTGEAYATVEHVAPSTDPIHGWDREIYKNTIVRHSLGNLVLLPAKENSAIGNESWKKKILFYNALTAPTAEEIKKKAEEASASGIQFSNATMKILNEGNRLSLLDPIKEVGTWNAELIKQRGENIASLTWDLVWPWLE